MLDARTSSCIQVSYLGHVVSTKCLRAAAALPLSHHQVMQAWLHPYTSFQLTEQAFVCAEDGHTQHLTVSMGGALCRVRLPAMAAVPSGLAAHSRAVGPRQIPRCA
jgi:hypothetical protein